MTVVQKLRALISELAYNQEAVQVALASTTALAEELSKWEDSARETFMRLQQWHSEVIAEREKHATLIENIGANIRAVGAIIAEIRIEDAGEEWLDGETYDTGQ